MKDSSGLIIILVLLLIIAGIYSAYCWSEKKKTNCVIDNTDKTEYSLSELKQLI